MTIVNRDLNFIYLKSQKTAGSSTELHLLMNTPLGGDIWNTVRNAGEYGIRVRKGCVFVPLTPSLLVTLPSHDLLFKNWPWRWKIKQHQYAEDLKFGLGKIWDRSFKVTNVRNPWDILVSAWKWHRTGRGGWVEPIEYSFDYWLRCALSPDPDERARVKPYLPEKLMHPYLYANGELCVNHVIRKEFINEDLYSISKIMNITIPEINIKLKTTDNERDYREYYTEESAERVGEFFSDIIALCDYRF